MATPTTEELLALAEAAYHDLMTGRAVVEVRDQNGESIRYNPANAYRLANYIAELKRQINGSGCGPMQVLF